MSYQSVDTIADLKALSPHAVTCVRVLGYHTRGDGGGGDFYWEPGLTRDNGGTVIAPSPPPPTGRWKRVVEGPISVKWFGAKGNDDPAWDDQPAIQAACDTVAASGGGEVIMPRGTYWTEGTITLTNYGVRICGSGSGTGAFGNKGTVISYKGTGYAIVIGNLANDVQYGFSIENLTIVGTGLGKAGIRVGAILAAKNQLRQVAIREVCVTGFTSPNANHDMSAGEYSATGGCGIFLHRGIHGVLDHCDLRANYIGLLEACNRAATTWHITSCYFQVNMNCGVRLTDSISVGFYNCIFESNEAQGLCANTTLGPNSLMSTYLRDCYFEDNCRSLPGGFDCHLVGKIYRATIEGLNVNVKNYASGGGSKGGVKLDGGAGCMVVNILIQDPAVSCVTTINSLGANFVTGLRADSNALNNGTYNLDSNTAFSDYIEGVVRIPALHATLV